jgi:hypothetical protein
MQYNTCPDIRFIDPKDADNRTFGQRVDDAFAKVLKANTKLSENGAFIGFD